MIRVTAHSEKGEEMLRNIRRKMTRTATMRVVRNVAEVMRGFLVMDTPKKWNIAMVRKSWRTEQITNGYSVINRNKVMLFLEEGTRDHGPSPGKKFLFIPLKRKWALAGARATLEAAKEGKAKFGRDFVLTKRVRGIRARHIVRNMAPKAERVMRNTMQKFIHSI